MADTPAPESTAPIKKAPTRKSPSSADKAATTSTALTPQPEAPAKSAATRKAPAVEPTVTPVSVSPTAEKIKAQAAKGALAAAAVGKDKAGSAIASLSKLIADNAEKVDDKLGPQYGDYARYAADAVAGMAKNLDTKEVDQLIDEARAFVKKSPAVAIGAAAVAGFVLIKLAQGDKKKKKVAKAPKEEPVEEA